MITRAQFAELALALPEATQSSHFGKPDFRVRNKIFAGLDSRAEQGSLKVRSEIQHDLVTARPDAFTPAAGAWGRSGWTLVMLEHVELDELKELLADAWRLVAPARLAAEHPANPAAPFELEVSALEPPRAARRKRTAPSSKPARKKKASAQSGPSSTLRRKSATSAKRPRSQ